MVIDRLYREIFDFDFQDASYIQGPGVDAARRDVEDRFGTLAPAVWPQWEAKLAARTEMDIGRLREQESLIKGEIERTLAVGRKVRNVLTAAGAPTRAEQIGVSTAELDAAIRHGRKIRDRYTALDVAAELGILDAFADRFIAESAG
jgi:glycerol-1-phosphate dehydrogenase [NAD(P)+]